MKQLLVLSLEGQPSADVIAGTLLSWCNALTHRRKFEEERDAPRFRQAFALLAEESRRWPPPAAFIEALPQIEGPEKSLRLESDAARSAGAEAIREIAEKLSARPPEPAKRKPLPPLESAFPRCCPRGTREQPICDECRAEAAALHGPVTRFNKQVQA